MKKEEEYLEMKKKQAQGLIGGTIGAVGGAGKLVVGGVVGGVGMVGSGVGMGVGMVGKAGKFVTKGVTSSFNTKRSRSSGQDHSAPGTPR